MAAQWGNWGGGGMAVRSGGFVERMERAGLALLDPGQGLETMACLLAEQASAGNARRWQQVRALSTRDAALVT